MSEDRGLHCRIVEALIFASPDPVDEKTIAQRLPAGINLGLLLTDLASHYAERGVRLVKIGPGWAFRTAPDLAPHLALERRLTRKLSRAALETLGIIAYHQPVTRADIEDIRGVALSKGSLDVLLETGWIKPGKRRRTPGRPLTWITTREFLDHFDLGSLDELPGLDELKASGLLESRPTVHAFHASETDPAEDEAEPVEPTVLDLDESDPDDEGRDTQQPAADRR